MQKASAMLQGPNSRNARMAVLPLGMQSIASERDSRSKPLRITAVKKVSPLQSQTGPESPLCE